MSADWRRPFLCRTPGCGWQGLNPLADGYCRWCDGPVFIVERSAEGSGIAPGDRIALTGHGVVNFGIPKVSRPAQ